MTLRLVILRILETFFRRRWLYLLPVLIMIVVGLAALLAAKPSYISRGVLYVQKGSLLATLTSIRQDTLTFITPAQATADEMSDLLQTDAFVRAIIGQTNLEVEMDGGPRAVKKTMQKVRKAVWVEEQGDNQVAVMAAFEDPEVAYQLAAATVESYLHWRINADRAESVSAQAFFADLIQQYQLELDMARREIENFLEAYPEPLRGVRPTAERLQLARLEAALDTITLRHAGALEKEENARLATAQAESDVRQSLVVIDAPRLPEEPERSLKQTAVELLIFLGAGIVLSGIALAGGTLLDRSFRFPLDVRHHLELPVLTLVPGPAAVRSPAPLRHEINLPVLALVPAILRDQKLLPVISRLRHVCAASEKGFILAAENVTDPALKLLLRQYAQERARFGRELATEGARLGLRHNLTWAPLAAIHRGWVNIKAAMTIDENRKGLVVLRECRRGEAAAQRNYRRALKRNLPPNIQRLAQRHYGRLQRVHEELGQLSGRAEVRRLPHLFNSVEEAELVVRTLQDAGFDQAEIDLAPLTAGMTDTDLAVPRSQVLVESAAAGALVGAVIGLVSGAAIGGLMVAAPGATNLVPAAVATTVASISLAGALIIGLFGAVLGGLIGLGVSQADRYVQADQSNGRVLLTVQTDDARSDDVYRILGQRNGRTHSISQPAAIALEQE
jgi:uncharacterized protein (TIGR02284 family)